MAKKGSFARKPFSFKKVLELIKNNDRDGLKSAFEVRGFNVNLADRWGKTALHYAAADDKIEILEILTSHPKIKINARDKGWMTPLMSAASHGHFRSVELLLEKGANASCSDRLGHNSLMIAAQLEYVECVKALLKSKSCLPNAKTRKGWYALMFGIGNDEIVKLLLDLSDVSLTNNAGYSAFHYACDSGSLATVKLIVEKNVLDINAKEKKHNLTPLQAALFKSKHKIADYLIQKGADPTIKDIDGHSAYTHAAKYDDSESFLLKNVPNEEFVGQMIYYLICFSRCKTLRAYAAKFIRCTEKYPNGPQYLKEAISVAFRKGKKDALDNLLSLLFERPSKLKRIFPLVEKLRSDIFLNALRDGNHFVCNYFLKRGFNPNGFAEGKFHLFRACKNNAALVESFLKFGADPFVKNQDGFTPLLKSAYRGYSDVFFELFKVDKDLSQRSNKGITPFLAACKSGNLEIVKALIEAGACVTDVDYKKRNCFHFAFRRESFCELVLLLFSKIDKKDCYEMMRAFDSYRVRPMNPVLRIDDKSQVTDLWLAIPDLANIISAPIRVNIKDINLDMCLICRDGFANNAHVIILPCKHLFHEDCYSEWGKRNFVCPYCRRSTSGQREYDSDTE